MLLTRLHGLPPPNQQDAEAMLAGAVELSRARGARARVFSEDTLCEVGVASDVVVSVVGPSPIPGIGGTGGAEIGAELGIAWQGKFCLLFLD